MAPSDLDTDAARTAFVLEQGKIVEDWAQKQIESYVEPVEYDD